jgi:hypothetical protein
MKVKELIDLLQKEDPDTLVLVDGYEGDYSTPKEMRKIEVYEVKESAWYYGNYKLCPKDELLRNKAIYLPR